ncbi:glycosyltransferase [Chthonobacter albigriseus]|uniref:glycosyltransferase n=1 Tax=Chthonobacter albigriseus TaxID=1683161 RepID=UPI0015EF48DB|nr:glycosyltransferase [Chthonobacter albigriseus]
MRPRTVISILTWDSLHYTRNLLLNLTWAVPGRNMSVMILDQGSGPDTVALLKEFVPGRAGFSARLRADNIGYGPGHNDNYRAALAAGPFDYFITVNSDALFGEAGWADRMVEAMEANPTAALGGPYAYRLDGQRYVQATREQAAAGDYLFITGAVAIMRASAVETAGLFDEAFEPAYWEDADMALRYERLGFSQIHIDIPVLHGYLGSAGRVNEAKNADLTRRWGDYKQRNLQLFSRRWMGPDALGRSEDPRGWGDRLYLPGR